jgi:hypothetical protein
MLTPSTPTPAPSTRVPKYWTLSFRRGLTSRFRFGTPVLKFGTLAHGGEVHIGKGGFPPLNGKKVLLMISGFNNSAMEAERSYLQILDQLQLREIGDYDIVIGLLWPGHEALGFGLAEMAADKAGRMLWEVLGGHKAIIDVETHSLGARVILQAMMHGIWSHNEIAVRNLILTSPAIPADSLDIRYGKYWEAVGHTYRTLVAYSRRDPVLKVWYHKWERLTNFLRRDKECEALGLVGPKGCVSYQVWAWDGTNEPGGNRHSWFKWSEGGFNSWALVVSARRLEKVRG